MLTANSHGDTAIPSKVSSALRSTSTASCDRRSSKPARSWRWPILAVVLGLFAHQDALAQTTVLGSLTLSDANPAGGGDIDLVPPFADVAAQDPEQRTFTAEVIFGVTQVTVVATAAQPGDWDVEVQGADANGVTSGDQRDLRLGTNTITVRATKTADPPEPQRNYTIRVRRLAEMGSALADLTVTQSGGAGDVGTLDPAFAAATDDRTFTADADRSVSQVRVAATAKSGWTVTYHDDPDVDGDSSNGYHRNLATGANRITVRATPTGASGTRNYTITVTRTTTPGAPRNLRATPFDQNVRLSWTAPSSNGGMPILNYRYRSKMEADEPFEDTDEWRLFPAGSDDSTTESVVTGLTNGIAYIFQVRAENANGGGSASNTADATPAGPLRAPANVTAEPGNRRVKLSWTKIVDLSGSGNNDLSVSGYQYQQRVGAGSYGGWRNMADRDLVEEPGSVNTLSYTVTGLTNDTAHDFRVRGENSVGGGSPSTEVTATPEAFAPGAPTNLSPTAGDGQVTLSWTAPRDDGGEPITGYEYWVDDASDPNPGRQAPGTATGGTGTTVTVHSLDPGSGIPLVNRTTYYFRVRAVNRLGCVSGSINEEETEGCGQWSLEVSATPVGPPVTEVNLATPVSDEDSRVELTWTSTIPANLVDTLSAVEDRSGFQYRQKAGGGYGSWIDIRNSNAFTGTHVVTGLTNGTRYTFEVRAVNSAGGGLASNEEEAVPSIIPGAPTLTATAGDKEVRLTWTPAANGGRRIIRYECRLRIGAGEYPEPPLCGAGNSLGASATSLTLNDDDAITTDGEGIMNRTTYTFQVRAVNARPAGAGEGAWSNEVSARPTDSPERSFTISATINGKSWAKAGSPATILATVEVDPRYTEQTTPLWVSVGSFATGGKPVIFGPTNSSRDVSFTAASPLVGDVTIALFSGTEAGTPSSALAVTRVEIRPASTPDKPTGLVAQRGDGEVTLSWATPSNEEGVNLPDSTLNRYNYEYQQKRQQGSYGRWTDFARGESRNGGVTTNTVTGLDGGTYVFRVRAIDVGASEPSDEVSVSLSGSLPTGPLSAPRNLTAAAGNGQVTLAWNPPQSGGGSITRYEYRRETTRNAGGGGTWTTTGGTGTTFTVTGLTNGTRYYFRVRAVTGSGPGPESGEASATPALTAGATLSTLTLSRGALTPTFTPATRDYTASVGASVTQVTVTATPTRGTAAITPADADTSAADHQVDLQVGTTDIRVTVTNGSATGVYTIRVTRAGSPPGADTTLSALVLSHGTLTPSFDPARRNYTTTVDGTVTQMTVTVEVTKSGATAVITPADANTSAGHQVDLRVGTTPITVTVTDGRATGAYTVGVTRTASVPAAPTQLAAASAGDGEVALSWTAPAPSGLAISRYEYQQKAGAGAYGGWTSIPDSGPTTSYIVTGLANGTTYAFKVRAVNEAGAGEASNEATATPAVARLVWAKTEREVADAITAARNAAFGADRAFTRGEAIEVMGDALFEAAEGVRVLYSASSSDDDVASASVSGGEVAVTAGATGTADITITANASSLSGVEILDQTNPREASILFTVDVGIAALTIELSGPAAETNVVEGGRTHANGTLGTVTVTATANRPVTNETTVMLRRDRIMSTAGDDDFEAEPIVIEAGGTTGSTVVTAVEDNTPEDREELVLVGVAADNAGEVTGEIKLRLWDAAVPALPFIAQLLLAAFLGVGGYRRYLRRR